MRIKTAADLKNLKTSGKKIGAILSKLAALCVPGITTAAIDAAAEKLIRAAGGAPAFKGYKVASAPKPFPATVCVSLNEELVHGIPSEQRTLKNGDLVSLDIGMRWPEGKKGLFSRAGNGVFTDTALTLYIGQPPTKVARLMAVTRQALEVGIAAARPGHSVASIGEAIQTFVEAQGKFGIVRDLVGHGVGHAVHEQPYIPNYYDPALESSRLEPGMVIAIEPMIALGGWRVGTLADGWTIKMADNSLCAHFEHTLIITKNGNTVVTRRPGETV